MKVLLTQVGGFLKEEFYGCIIIINSVYFKLVCSLAHLCIVHAVLYIDRMFLLHKKMGLALG